MRIDSETIADVLVLRVREPQVTSHEAPEFKTQLLGAIAGKDGKILVDLEAVDNMDSTGLGALLFGIRQADQHEKDLRLSGIKNKVQFLIHVAHLDDVLEFYPTVDEAIQAFAGEPGDGIAD